MQAKPAELSENEIQRAIFKHLRERGARGVFAFHPKNASADMAGRKRGIHVGLGVEPGVPDVIVLKSGATRHTRVFALELKRLSRLGKKPTQHELNQDMTRARMINCNVTVGVAYGLDDALRWLEEHGLLRGTMS